MISIDHVRLMANYNRWQNQSLYRAANGIGDDERRRDRGAFFGSIHATLSHILWADQVWMHRLVGWAKPTGSGFADSLRQWPEWSVLVAERQRTDAALIDWSQQLTPNELAGDYAWYSAAAGRDMRKPRWLLFTHMFNHQTHHRGQVHAMLTQAGAKPEDTDIPLMP
ncbi:MAG: DUF664 domain-containing protein [Alphaproteobacteria bacterium]|nr:DUF664 domain-containing protein [Alphaproteobacteria bacterium]